MSFLAGLRQQKSAAGQQLKLCYLLENSGACRGVRISLVMAEFEQGHPAVPGMPYIIRPEHLYSPPPYLNARDLPILQQLLDDSAAWLDETAGFLPYSSSHQLLEQMVSEGRAVLIFSQFTSMLDVLSSALSVRGIDYLMLTGSSRERGILVDAFQRGEAPVFLISLKAGGVGLNLTCADTVIHYDPWWNSAAEQQAADRAHRIGQEKPVFVYKLIMEDSVEEKIAEIQLQKAALGWHICEQAKRSGEHFALGLQELLALMQDTGETSGAAVVNS